MSSNLTGSDLVAMSWDDRRMIARYSEAQRELKALEDQLVAIQPVINQIIAGLPENIRVMTVTQFSGYDKRPPTNVFHFKSGEWREYGQVVTEGACKEFYGDGGFITVEGLFVITDSHSGVGISVADKTIEFVDLNDDPHERTTGGSSPQRHAHTLSYLADVKPGEVTYFNCIYP